MIAQTQYQAKPKTPGVNNWKLSGKVLKKVVKSSANGALIVTILLEIPAKNPKYNTKVWLKAFNSTKDETKDYADQINGIVEEGKDYFFSGSFTSSEYADPATKQTKTRSDQVIWKVEPVVAGAADSDGDQPPF